MCTYYHTQIINISAPGRGPSGPSKRRLSRRAVPEVFVPKYRVSFDSLIHIFFYRVSFIFAKYRVSY